MIASTELTSAGFAVGGVTTVVDCCGAGALPGAGFGFWAIARPPKIQTIAQTNIDLTQKESLFMT
jgi:hypothetical protein